MAGVPSSRQYPPSVFLQGHALYPPPLIDHISAIAYISAICYGGKAVIDSNGSAPRSGGEELREAQCRYHVDIDDSLAFADQVSEQHRVRANAAEARLRLIVDTLIDKGESWQSYADRLRAIAWGATAISSNASVDSDPGSAAYEDARTRLVATLSEIGSEDARNGFSGLADAVRDGEGVDIPSWVALQLMTTPSPDSREALRAALERAADEFDLIVHRLRENETERAEGAAVCGARDVRAALETSK